MALAREEARKLVALRAPEWIEHEVQWKWLLDSYEGGVRYRDAIYGSESHPVYQRMADPISGAWSTAYAGTRSMLRRNLIRHRREYPTYLDDPSGYPIDGDGNTATSDEYEMRRMRTPVPEFVSEAIGVHLAKLYGVEVRRAGPDRLNQWWDDIDGRGTPIDDWMAETVAPLLFTLGQLDLAFDHPRAPGGSVIASRADETRLRLDRCIADYILPQNMLWWILDALGRYTECLVQEIRSDGLVLFRHWTADGSALYDVEGTLVEEMPHSFGAVPICRVFDQRKFRCRNVGRSRYDRIAQLQREFYNVDSELILTCSLQAHPHLSGAVEQGSDGTVPVGPQYMLPKVQKSDGSYEPWEYVSPPSEPADKLRQRQIDIRDQVDRAAYLTKPAGASGSTATTVSQSGISKVMDAATGNEFLKKQAKTLRRAEMQIAAVVLRVLDHGEPTPETLRAVTTTYPSRFDLATATELADQATEFQAVVAAAGSLPENESKIIKQIRNQILTGLEDDEYKNLDIEIDEYLEEKVREADRMAEMRPVPPEPGGVPPDEDVEDVAPDEAAAA